MSYRQFSKEERIKLEAYLKLGLSGKDCALKLGRSPSTVSNEISRNCDILEGELYCAKIAHQRSLTRKRKPPKKLEVDLQLQRYTVDKLLLSWSPEQISGRLKSELGYKVIHFDTIYWWIYQERKDLVIWLRHGKKRKWRRRKGTKIREKLRELAKKRWIHERPKIIDKRKRLGDWEGDTMVGIQGEKERLATYTDRKSGFLACRKLESGTAQDFQIATKVAFSKIPKKKKLSLTFDNGVEMSYYESIERDTKITIYFAHPYSSWERGTNENTNGLLRSYFPKKSSFKYLTQKQIDKAVKEINNRPRKRLNYLTPYEAFNDFGSRTN